MTNQVRCLLAAVSVATLLTSASYSKVLAQDVYTDPVGFYKLTCLAGGDTVVAVPFTRLPAYSGLIESTSGSILTISNNPSFAAGQLVYSAGVQSNHYYAFIATGTKEGAIYPITNNTANTIDVELLPEDLSGVAAGDQIRIVPYWTLATAFADGSGVIPTASPGNRQMELQIPNLEGTGINQSMTSTYYFFTNASVRAWRLVGGGTTSRNDEILLPDAYVVLRNNTASNTQVVTPGLVPMKKQRTAIASNGTGGTQRDNYVALIRPSTMTLSNSLLYQSGAFKPSASAGIRTDELQVYNNADPSQNKSTVATYYYFTNATTSAWRLVGGGTTDRGTNEVFQPGVGVVIRTSVANVATNTIWINSPNY